MFTYENLISIIYLTRLFELRLEKAVRLLQRIYID